MWQKVHVLSSTCGTFYEDSFFRREFKSNVNFVLWLAKALVRGYQCRFSRHRKILLLTESHLRKRAQKSC